MKGPAMLIAPIQGCNNAPFFPGAAPQADACEAVGLWIPIGLGRLRFWCPAAGGEVYVGTDGWSFGV